MEAVQAYDVPTMEQGEVTALLTALRRGETKALGELMPVVYEELRHLAHYKLRFERPGHTLNTTALVHEAYLRLADQRWGQVQDRAHFFAIAAQAMRRILVSYARRHHAAKRGGQAVRVPFDEVNDVGAPGHVAVETHNLLTLNAALTRLEAFNERGCRVVEYRFFGGMTYGEIAEVMDLSTVTVRRAWTLAKMWLRREMQREEREAS